jgi:hypothetical protein
LEAHSDVYKHNDRLVRIYQQLLGGELPPIVEQLKTV